MRGKDWYVFELKLVSARSFFTMPESLLPFDCFENRTDELRGKYGYIDHVFIDLQQAGLKHHMNLDCIWIP